MQCGAEVPRFNQLGGLLLQAMMMVRISNNNITLNINLDIWIAVYLFLKLV